MAAPDNDPSNINTYSGYDDPTGTPSPSTPDIRDTHTVTLSQATYDQLVADGDVKPEITYVIV